jgi:hypothetical protein
MSDQAELAFVRGYSNILASQPVTFENDFQEQPEKTLKKVPVLPVGPNRFFQRTCVIESSRLGGCSCSPRVEKEG